jgi:hypothetical protein
MPATVCAAHAGKEAAFRCDGCGRLLCADCVEVGHRLLFCRHCRERALPLAGDAPATAPEHRRATAQAAPYGLARAFAYPWRGRGGLLFWVYVALGAILTVVGLVPGAGLLRLLLWCMITFLVPGLLCVIVRATAAGENELPDWPDLTDYGERVAEVLGLAGVAVLAALPAGLAQLAGGCSLEDLLAREVGAACRLLWWAGLLPGIVVAVPAVVAVAVWWSPWLVLRLDLHVRALAACGADAFWTAGLLYLLVLGRQLVAPLSWRVPILGQIVVSSCGIYALFVGAHLVGLLVRRHERALDAIYMP